MVSGGRGSGGGISLENETSLFLLPLSCSLTRLGSSVLFLLVRTLEVQRSGWSVIGRFKIDPVGVVLSTAGEDRGPDRSSSVRSKRTNRKAKK